MSKVTPQLKPSGGQIGCGVLVFIAMIAGISLFTSGAGLRRIDAGEVGVRFDAASGNVTSVVQPKLEWYGPWERLITYPSSLLTSNFVKASGEGERGAGDDSVRALTRSGTIIQLDVSVSWRVQADQIMSVFKSFGERAPDEITRRYIRPLTYAATNEVVGTLSVEEVMVQKRPELSPRIKERLVEMIGNYGITIDDVNVGEVYPDPKVKQAIDELAAARNELQFLAKREETTKEEARALVTEAQGRSEQARLLSTLGDKVLQSKRLEIARIRAERWNGSEAVVGPKPK